MTGVWENHDSETSVVQLAVISQDLADLQASIAALRRERCNSLGTTVDQQDLDRYARLERSEKAEMKARRSLFQALMLGGPVKTSIGLQAV